MPRKLAADLFDLQMWLWGQDVTRQDGNLLAEYGLGRDGVPEQRSGSSCYRSAQNDPAVVLWSWGIFFGKPGHGGVFVRRQQLETGWRADASPPGRVWAVTDLPCFPPPDAAHRRDEQHLLGEAFTWMAQYERWALTRCGVESRRQTAAGRPKPPPIDAANLADWWEQLADEQAAWEE